MKIPWRTSMGSWPITGRAFRRASASPALAAALAFTFVLTVLGSIAYVAALPGLASESPLLRELTGTRVVQPGVGGPLSATGAARSVEGTSGVSDEPLASLGLTAPGVDAQAGALGAQGSAATLPSANATGAAAGAPALPGAASPGAAAAAGSSAAAQPSSGKSSAKKPGSAAGSSGSGNAGASSAGGQGASGSGSNGSSGGSGNAGGSGSGTGNGGANGGGSSSSETGGAGSASDPEPVLPPSEGGPVPEDMELSIRDALRSEFDILDGYADQVYSCAADFNRLSLTTPKDPRLAAARTVHDLLYQCQVANAHISETLRIACGMSQEYGGMWGTSRYIGNYAKLQHCYGHLINLLYELDNAWSGNCYFDDPAAHTDYWGDRVTVNKKTGKMKYLEDYEAERKGARP